MKTHATFRFNNPMGRVVRFWAKIWRLGPSDSQIRFYTFGFCKIGLHKQAHPFFTSKNKNQKLGMRSHKKRPQPSSCFLDDKSIISFAAISSDHSQLTCTSRRVAILLHGLFVWSLQLWKLRVVSDYRPNMGYLKVDCWDGVFAHEVNSSCHLLCGKTYTIHDVKLLSIDCTAVCAKRPGLTNIF